MNIFPVNINDELLAEFIENIEENHQSIEILAIQLEKYSGNLSLLNELRDYFTSLMFSAAKLDLTPISESIADTISAIDVLIQLGLYPARMSEFILLVVDRLLLLARDIDRQRGIDIRKSQHILVALQHIITLKDATLLDVGINNAISAIIQEVKDGSVDIDNDINSDIFLFDDDDEANLDSNIAASEAGRTLVDVFVPEESKNPLLLAREEIVEYLKDNPVELLATISDVVTASDIAHTQFLLEFSLAINNLAGNEIENSSLLLGICVHDLPLASIPAIINKKTRLTGPELEKIRAHPIAASKLVDLIQGSDVCKEIVLHHHERIDGRGYPEGLKGNNISEGGKILSIVDAFHGMTESRPYKKYPRSMLRAVAEINACIDTQFDSHWVKVFNKFVKNYWLPMRRQYGMNKINAV